MDISDLVVAEWKSSLARTFWFRSYLRPSSLGSPAQKQGNQPMFLNGASAQGVGGSGMGADTGDVAQAKGK